MGLWSKGVRRSKTGEVRMEDDTRMFLEFRGRNIHLDKYPEMLDLTTGEWVDFSPDKYMRFDNRSFTPHLKFKISHAVDMQFIKDYLDGFNGLSPVRRTDYCTDCKYFNMLDESSIDFENLFIYRIEGDDVVCSIDNFLLHFYNENIS